MMVSSLYLMFFMNVGIDLQDSFYWLNQHRTSEPAPFYPLSQFAYNTLNQLGLTNYKIFFVITTTIWLLQFAVCARINKPIAIGLFVLSLYWFSGILSPDCFSMLGVLGLMLYTQKKQEPRVFVMTIIILGISLIKITSIILLGPMFIYIAWRQWRIICLMLISGLSLIALAYFYSDTISQHLTPETLFNQYCMQGIIVLTSTRLTHLILNSKYTLSPFSIFLIAALTETLCITALSHRIIAAIILGVSIGACLAHHKSIQKIFSRNNTFVLSVLILSFTGSNTGVYKCIYLLPLLTFLDTPKKNSPAIMKLSLAIAAPLIILKPLYFNFGASFEGAKIARSILTTQVDSQLTTWAVPDHGTFVVCNWLPTTVAKIDSAVYQHGPDNLSFVGPYSSFFNERYNKSASPLFLGAQSEELQTKFIIGQHVDQTKFNHINEFHPALSLFEKSPD